MMHITVQWIYLIIALMAGTFAFVPDVTEDGFPSIIKDKKCMIFYVVKDNCPMCKLLYLSFLTVAQTFRYDKEILFGRVSDPALVAAFGLNAFPGIVFYEYGSAVPKIYLDDITSSAVSRVVSDAMKRDSRKLDKQFALELTSDIFDEVITTSGQHKLVMLHEAGDEDDIAAYEELAETFENEHEVVIARINVDFENYLRKSFGAVVYPSFYWYPKGSERRMRYGGELNVGQMISFVNKEAGMFRTKGGRLNPYAGLIKQFDEVLSKHARDMYEIKNFDTIKDELRKAQFQLPKDTDEEIADFYFEILNGMEEDKTIESLDETRNRLYRRMNDVGPLGFDMLIKKRNVVQKIIDIIGHHLLEQLSDGDFGEMGVGNLNEEYDEYLKHSIEFHEEL
ncbi:uncharacterized protein LOC128231417 [Mya arenaria]|uniref:uncharacterized protein LOC128231417 n=1 Tax=Mya arenaria TaxID=6604 RepID=UPI0022E0ECFE|nr:uncharacterized protein LOC128231417 [Mya arenaria]